jgi:hypothetical protein
MPTSSSVRAFIASLPANELYIELLRDLGLAAKRLASEEPQLVGALTLIRDSFAAVTNNQGQAQALVLDPQEPP